MARKPRGLRVRLQRGSYVGDEPGAIGTASISLRISSERAARLPRPAGRCVTHLAGRCVTHLARSEWPILRHVDAAQRWSDLVAARAEAVRERAASASSSAKFWDRRAATFARRFANTAEHDPLQERLRPWLDVRRSFLDVGCGTGRFSLECAHGVAEVTAVDPSSAMLQILRDEALRRAITNICCVHAKWEEAEVAAADVTLCAHVLPFIEDAAKFLDRLNAFSRKRVFVYMNALGSETPDPLWRHFHGEPLPPSPTYLDAIEVLRELGIEADVEIVELPRVVRYATIEEALREHEEALALDPDRAPELLSILKSWLVSDGTSWRPPFGSLPAAILSWTPRR